MVLDNINEVLAAIEKTLSSVKDDMFDMGGELLHGAEDYLPLAWEDIQKLYPIKDAIVFMKENYPELNIHVSLSEIGLLNKITTVKLVTL